MSTLTLVLTAVGSVLLLLFLVMKARMHAFVALMVVSIGAGLFSGMPLDKIAATMEKGMGGTLGFLAIVVALGAMFGKILHETGAVDQIAVKMLKSFGHSRAHYAIGLAGLICALPLFFEVAIVLLISVAFSMARHTGTNLVKLVIPLFAGVAAAAAFLLPGPAPMLLASQMHADFGWMILIGLCAAIPGMIIAGPLWGNFISRYVELHIPDDISEPHLGEGKMPSFGFSLSLILLPLVIYAIYPPQLKKTPEIPSIAREELRKMGPMSLAEKILAFDFVLLILLWTVGDIFFSIPATLSAFIGLMVLLISNIMSWKNIIEEKTAWDTMFWFAVLVMMANALNKYGMISWISERIVGYVGHFEWITVFLLLVVVYFYTRYFFASAMAHISAMYLAFLAVAVSVGVPPLFAALVLGYTSNLSMGLTQYSGGPGPALFGSGYNTTGQWWGVSFVVSLASIAIWLVLGGAWMKLVGFW